MASVLLSYLEFAYVNNQKGSESPVLVWKPFT